MCIFFISVSAGAIILTSNPKNSAALSLNTSIAFKWESKGENRNFIFHSLNFLCEHFIFGSSNLSSERMWVGLENCIFNLIMIHIKSPSKYLYIYILTTRKYFKRIYISLMYKKENYKSKMLWDEFVIFLIVPNSNSITFIYNYVIIYSLKKGGLYYVSAYVYFSNYNHGCLFNI